MAITALSSVQPLPQLTALQAKQITESTPVETTRKPNNVAAYASPVYKFDPLAKLNIELIRDTSTGSVLNQIPPEQVVQRYRLGLATAGNAAHASQNSALSANSGVTTVPAAAAAATSASAVASGSSVGSSVSITV